MTNNAVLKVENLVTHFKSVERGKVVRAVDDVSIELMPGEIVGLIGESGCGKSTLGRSIVGLEKPNSGKILMDGVDLSSLKGKSLRTSRRSIQYVFQDPYSSLNDRQTIGESIGEALLIIGIRDKKQRSKRIHELLDRVGLPKHLSDRYGRELSGGQRQRVAVARSLAVNPRVLICDEPVSALDLSVRAQVMNLFFDLQKDLGVACLFIAHDLALVRQAATRTYVMYLGSIVEAGSSQDINQNPGHPYAQALLSAIPNPDPRIERNRKAIPIIGDIPSPTDPPSGCRFRTRCPIVVDQCAETTPESITVSDGHYVACRFAERNG